MAARKIVFEVEINGVTTAIRNEKELADAVKLVSQAYKQADYGTDEREQLKTQLGALKSLQADQRAEVRESARQYKIAADQGKDSYRALNAELVSLRNTYKELSREERDAFGPQLINRINTLDRELKDLDAEMGNYQRNVGNYSEGIQNAFSALGGFDLASFTNPATAAAAIGTAAVAATQQVIELTAEVRELRGSLQNLVPEATAEDLDGLTAQVLGIAETFDQSNQEIVNAANSVANQFGIPFEEALANIEEGFIAGSNQTGEFLDNLREYPAFFQEAGINADQFFRIINQQATEGIYSDKGVDAIKEATLRLRELPTATRDALAAIEIDSEDIRRTITEDGIGAAIAQVSERLGQLEADSPQVGQAIADIFGGPGEDAGLNFLLSLQNIDDATGDLIDTSNEYQQQQARTLEVNKEFAAVQVEVANAFGGTGSTLSNLSTQFQTFLLRLVIPLIERFRALWQATEPLRDALFNLAERIGLVSSEGSALDVVFKVIEFQTKIVAGAVNILSTAVAFVVDRFTDLVGAGRDFLEFIGLIGPETESANEATRNMGRFNREAAEELRRRKEAEAEAAEQSKRTKEETEALSDATSRLSNRTKEAAVATDQFARGSISALRAEIQTLRRELDATGPEGQEGILSRLLDAEAALDKAERFREELRNRIARGDEPVPIVGTISELRADAGLKPEAIEIPPVQSVEAERERAAEIEAIIANRNERLLTQQTDFAAAFQEIQDGIFEGIGDALGALTEASEAREEREVEAIENRYAREIELAEGNTERQEQLAEELDRERRAIQQREFQRQKRYREAAALASLAEGIVNILSAPSTIPDPFGTAFKAVRIGILTATTARQIATINAQTVAAKGAVIEGRARGASHSDPSGGIDLLFGNQRVKIENGERLDYDEDGNLVVVNKRSAAVFDNELSAVQGVTFAGKRAYLSSINAFKNYGVGFAAQGGLFRPSLDVLTGASGGSVDTRVTAQVTMSESSVADIAERTAAAVASGAYEGVRAGLSENTRAAQREQALRQRTKV